MSLAGNLSDLSLPELLQLVAMSRKTGALEVCSEQGGVAWLGVRSGSIVRVALERGDLEPEQILKNAGLSLESPSDVVEAALWEAAVQAILRIFEWTQAEFTFDPLADPIKQWRWPEGIVLPSPLSPDFLALEGARLLDESGGASASLDEAGELPAPTDPSTASELDELDACAAAASAPGPESEIRASDPLPIDDATRVYDAPPAVMLPPPRALICVDSDLPMLEKLKQGLQTPDTRIHIFQSATDALQRFRQYLATGETPALIVGSMVEDPFEAHLSLGWRRFAGRVLALSARVRVVVVARTGEKVAAPGIAVVCRPDSRTADERDYRRFVEGIGRALSFIA